MITFLRVAAPLTCLVLAAGCAGKFLDMPKAREGIDAAEPVLAAISGFRQSQGRYPQNLSELSLAPDVQQRAESAGLRYFALSNPDAYSIGFTFPAWPFTVGCVPTGKTQQWQCLGK